MLDAKNEPQDKFYGKYRGEVTDNIDPDRLGRIRATVHMVLEDRDIGWAMPCVPYAGKNVGIFFIPPKGSNVWIEFEQGDVHKPIFSGCFWNLNQVPDKNSDPNIKIIKTEHITLTIDDNQGKESIEIKTLKNQKLIIEPDSIDISHKGCSIKVTETEVSINGKNLQVLK